MIISLWPQKRKYCQLTSLVSFMTLIFQALDEIIGSLYKPYQRAGPSYFLTLTLAKLSEFARLLSRNLAPNSARAPRQLPHEASFLRLARKVFIILPQYPFIRPYKHSSAAQLMPT